MGGVILIALSSYKSQKSSKPFFKHFLIISEDSSEESTIIASIKPLPLISLIDLWTK